MFAGEIRPHQKKKCINGRAKVCGRTVRFNINRASYPGTQMINCTPDVQVISVLHLRADSVETRVHVACHDRGCCQNCDIYSLVLACTDNDENEDADTHRSNPLST